MKVNFKRVATAALAVAMSLSLNVSAFAAAGTVVGNQDLTVNQQAGKDVTIVRMFTATVTEADTEDQYDYASYTLDTCWAEFFTAEEDAGGVGLTVGEGDSVSEVAVDHIKELNDTEMAELADLAQAWYRDHSADFADAVKKTKEVEENQTSVVFTELTTGYYLVFPEMGSTGEEKRGTDAILVNVPSNKNGVTVTLKSTYPTVDKTVDTDKDTINKFEPDGTANVGDTVTFKLETTITDLSDFDKYRLAFVDELSEGLTYVDGSVKVYYLKGGTGELSQGEQLTKDTHYTVTKTPGLKIELTDVLGKTSGIEGIKAGDKIGVTYDATINSNAITEVDYVNNKVHLDYSNNPNGDGHGTSTPDESKVYIYDFTIDKYTMVPSGEPEGEPQKENLSGAVFELKKEKRESAEPIKLIAVSDQENTTYRVATPDEIESGTGIVTQVTTPDSGQITIDGLEAGTYYLYEVTAPTGYNKLANPIEVKINVTDGDYDNAVITVDGKENVGDNTTVGVLNKKGIELPETGSIGTIGLTVAGVAIVLLGVFAPRKKKKSNQE